MNFESVLFYKNQAEQDINGSGDKKSDKNMSQYISKFTVPAVEGFFRY